MEPRSPERQRATGVCAASIFVGGCTVEAAESACDATLDTLQSLVEKNLLRRSGKRFWMLETIRQYAVERLDASGEADDARRRAFDFFLASADAANLSEDAEGPTRFDLAFGEIDNMRAALDWAESKGDIELALRLAVALELIWSTANVDEGIRRLRALLERATEPRVPAILRARALRTLSGPYQRSGDGTAAERAIRDSLAIYRALGDEDGIAQLQHRLGVSALLRGDHARARTLLEESLELGRRLGRRRIEAVNIGTLGDLEYRQGNYEEGLDLLRQSAVLAEEAGHFWWQSMMFAALAAYAMDLGRVADAEAYARRTLELASRMRDRLTVTWTIAIMAPLAAAQGEAARAGTLWGAMEAEEARGPVGGWEEGERERYEAAVLEAAGPELDRGREHGRRLALEEAVEFALSAEASRSA